MKYPTYAQAKALAEQEAESYTSKHGNELTARLMDHAEPDEETSHDSLGWCALYIFPREHVDAPPVEGAAIVWEHEDGWVTLEEFGDYASVYASWQSYYLTRWEDETESEDGE
jgi:hypothetical protein